MDSKNSSNNSSSAYRKNDAISSDNSGRDNKSWSNTLGISNAVVVSLFGIDDFEKRRDYVSYFPHNNLPIILGKFIAKRPTLKVNLLNLTLRKAKGSMNSYYSSKYR